MKNKYGWTHKTDYDFKKHRTPFKGATQAQFEKKHTIPNQHKDVKKLIKRVEEGRPKPELV